MDSILISASDDDRWQSNAAGAGAYRLYRPALRKAVLDRAAAWRSPEQFCIDLIEAPEDRSG
ncbi:MAG: hypothetical protein U0703_21635 [Anaerolineae bacterium]